MSIGIVIGAYALGFGLGAVAMLPWGFGWRRRYRWERGISNLYVDKAMAWSAERADLLDRIERAIACAPDDRKGNGTARKMANILRGESKEQALIRAKAAELRADIEAGRAA